MSRAQHILAIIGVLITGVLLMESYGAMVDAARVGGRAIPELWPLGTEALALAMEVSVLEAKRLGHRAVLRLSWLLLVASVALSTLLQVAVAPPTLVGYLTAGATPVWLLGSFAVLSLLYRTPTPAADSTAEVEDQGRAGEELSKRERAHVAYAALVASGQPVTGARLAEAADISASYGRALWPSSGPTPPHRPSQRAATLGGGGAVTATICGPAPVALAASSNLMTRAVSRLMLPGLPAGRLPRPSTLQHRPAQRPPRVALGVASAAPPARRL